MPRDGSGNYTQPFDDVITETTISSSVYNGTINDIETDLNTPRPVIAGGTGATTAAAARTSLQVEIAAASVANYNSHVFESGSFISPIGATGAPNSTDYFVGHAVILTPPNISLVIQARSLTSGQLWWRIKAASVWGTWTVDGSSRYVDVTGDTMTGTLIVPQLTLNHPNTFILSDGTDLVFRTNGDAIVRNAAGDALRPIHVNTPTISTHAATKAYVDTTSMDLLARIEALERRLS